MSEALSDFINAYLTIAIQVKQIKGNFQVLTVYQPCHICCAGQEFTITNLTVTISV